jgi:hypothetical protein
MFFLKILEGAMVLGNPGGLLKFVHLFSKALSIVVVVVVVVYYQGKTILTDSI